MNKTKDSRPELAEAILAQLERLVNDRAISDTQLRSDLARLQKEELSPRRLTVRRQPVNHGRIHLEIVPA